MLFNLGFANNPILRSFFSFFLIIDLYILIIPAIAHIFNPIAGLVIPIGNSEIEIHPVIVEAKIRKCSIEFRVVKNFVFLLFTYQFILLYFFKEIISCFIYIFKSKFLKIKSLK